MNQPSSICLTTFVTYKDQVLKEDIINIEDAIEGTEADKSFLPEENQIIITREVTHLKRLCDHNDASYIRFAN